MKRVVLMLWCVLTMAACSDDEPMSTAEVKRDPVSFSVTGDPNLTTIVFGYAFDSYAFNPEPFKFTVPEGLTSITVEAFGAQGGDGRSNPNSGGMGGRVSGELTVTPGEVLTIYVGGRGGIGMVEHPDCRVYGGCTLEGSVNDGFNGGGYGGLGQTYHGGGGGGASDIRRGAEKLIVAAGGGGGGGCEQGGVGGAGGKSGVMGGSGFAGGGFPGGEFGFGGGVPGRGYVGAAGVPGQGGNGGGYYALRGCGGGGGGGGAWGGGGGSSTIEPASIGGGGGGGGSSSGPIGAIFETGVRAGNGEVRISYVLPNLAPVFSRVRPLSPLTVDEGVDISFEATATDRDNDPLIYSWTFGENEAGETGATATYAYGDNGQRTATVYVNDGKGHTTQSAIIVTVNNVAPTATFMAPERTPFGQPYELSLVQIHDAAGDLPSLQFAFSCDGVSFGAWGNASSMTCPAVNAGSERSVRARIRDKDGALSSYNAHMQFDNANADPVIASHGGPYSGNEGSVISFTASASDEDGDNLSYAWTFGDGGTGQGAAATHRYVDNGSYKVTLTVTDANGGTATQSTTADVLNLPPNGSFDAPHSVNEGDAFTLMLVAVGDPSPADVVQIAYTCDGSTWTDYGSLDFRNYRCPGAAPGMRTVGVRLRDDDGGVTTYTAQVEVIAVNKRPVINAQALNANPVFDESPSVATFDVSGAISDPDGDKLSCSWKFSDLVAPANGCSTTRSYDDNGQYTATMTVSDGKGGTASFTFNVTVRNLAPHDGFYDFQGHMESEMINIFLNVSDSPADKPTLQYSFSCDGVSWTAFVVADNRGLCRATHAGLTKYYGKVRDKDGGESSYTFELDIGNASPVVAAFAGAEILAGETYNAAGSFKDAGEDPPYRATANYGDGSATQQLTLTNQSFTLSHRYTTAGTYNVVVEVTDGPGMSGKNTATVTVLSASDATQKLASSVTIMVSNGNMRSSDAAPLQNSLDNVSKHLAAGKKDQAIKELDSFIKKVEGMVPSKLSAANAAALIDYAKRLQVSINK